jgi:MoxR-like ATPase
MQEDQVTVDGTSYPLERPFVVLATQNPIEYEGTYPLPEAQLDRFMLRHRLKYPTPDEEREVLRRNMALGVKREGSGAVARTEFDVLEDEPVGTVEDLVTAMEAAAQIHVSDTFVEHVVDTVTRTRSHPHVELGASPRAGIALIKAAKARALIRGRGYVVPDDLYALAPDVILHRIRLTYEALADGLSGDDVLQDILHDLTRGRKAAAARE